MVFDEKIKKNEKKTEKLHFFYGFRLNGLNLAIYFLQLDEIAL